MASLIPKYSLQTARKQITCIAAVAVQTNRYLRQSTLTKIIEYETITSLKKGTHCHFYQENYGRRSNKIVCTVFGATGFVGRYLCHRLNATDTHQLILPYRTDGLHDYKPEDAHGFQFHSFDLRDDKSIRKCIEYSDVVINLIGRDWESENFTFHEVNVEGPKRIARLCKEANIKHFIHMSALNVGDKLESHVLKDGSQFLRTKWEGECAVREEFPKATIIRPSDICGIENQFLRVGRCLCVRDDTRTYYFGVSIWENNKTEKQPVNVYDVAKGIAAIVKDPENTAGKIYQFVGPKRYKQFEFMEMSKDPLQYGEVDTKKYVLFARFKTLINELEHLSNEEEHLERGAICDKISNELLTLEDLGITLTQLKLQHCGKFAPFRYRKH